MNRKFYFFFLTEQVNNNNNQLSGYGTQKKSGFHFTILPLPSHPKTTILEVLEITEFHYSFNST